MDMQPRQSQGLCTAKGPTVKYSAAAILKYLVSLEQGALHFHYSLDSQITLQSWKQQCGFTSTPSLDIFLSCPLCIGL